MLHRLNRVKESFGDFGTAVALMKEEHKRSLTLTPVSPQAKAKKKEKKERKEGGGIDLKKYGSGKSRKRKKKKKRERERELPSSFFCVEGITSICHANCCTKVCVYVCGEEKGPFSFYLFLQRGKYMGKAQFMVLLLPLSIML